MRVTWLVICVLLAFNVFGELLITPTLFRKAPLKVVSVSAQQNNPEAQLELAFRYYAGHQVPKDAASAFSWMQKAADQKNPLAMRLLSQMYAEGIGVSSDSRKAELLFAAALAADPDNSAMKGRFKQLVQDKRQSGENADAFLKECADAGYTPAYIAVYYPVATNLYAAGQYDEAAVLLKNLSDRGNAASSFYLAEMYAKGQGSVLQNDDEAYALYQKAAEGGSAEAQCALAAMYEQGAVDSGRRNALYEKASEGGSAEAAYRVAETEFSAAMAAASRMSSGSSVDKVRSKNEYAKHLKSAVNGYKLAAGQDHPAAQYALGRLYASGEGVSRNFKQAIQCYESSAAQGYAPAVFYLGLMYHAGLGVEKNLPEAVSKYRLAAAAGNPGALFYLGNGYRFEEGLPLQPLTGESFYYEKILKKELASLQASGGQVDVWVCAAAREYGCILWSRADSPAHFAAAAGWVGMAASAGDELALDLCLKMNQRGAKAATVTETQVDPKADAVRRRRSPAYYQYVQFPFKELYASAGVQPVLVSVDKSIGQYKTVDGSDAEGLFLRYMRPSREQALDFSGIVLAGVELTDVKTGEHFFASSSYLDTVPPCSSESFSDLFVSVDKGSCPDAKITGWAVVYGHLLSDGRTVAVFDARQSRAVSLTELFERNRYSRSVGSRSILCNDTWAIMGVNLDDIDSTAAEGLEDGSGIIQTVIDILNPVD